MKLLILNGFDRSGTSFIGGLLAQHPDINYFFHPFSSTEVHRTQFEIWRKGHHAPGPEAFLSELQKGRVDSSFISSDWFDRHSSYSAGPDRKVALIKDTKLHAKIGWLKGTVPEAGIYGIWRDPRAILYSLIRNGFHTKWYGEQAFRQVSELIRTEPELECFVEYLEGTPGPEMQMALIIAARTRLMLMDLEQEQWLFYEDIAVNPNSGLSKLCRSFGISDYDFTRLNDKDFNVIGLPYQNKDMWRSHLPARVLLQVQPIFESIYQPDVESDAIRMSKV